MSIETQQTIGNWARATFPGGDDLSPRHCVRLLEEVVELCLAAGARYRDIHVAVASVLEKDGAVMSLLGGVMDVAGGTCDPGKVPEEMADCAIVLDVLAERRGVDLRAEVDIKMARNRKRTWRVGADGTGYHTSEPPVAEAAGS
jgi:hypothetical protein